MQKLKPDNGRDSKSSQGARNMPICPLSCIAAFLLEPSLKCSFGTEHRRSTTCRKSRHKMCHGACPQTTPFQKLPGTICYGVNRREKWVQCLGLHQPNMLMPEKTTHRRLSERDAEQLALVVRLCLNVPALKLPYPASHPTLGTMPIGLHLAAPAKHADARENGNLYKCFQGFLIQDSCQVHSGDP